MSTARQLLHEEIKLLDNIFAPKATTLPAFDERIYLYTKSSIKSLDAVAYKAGA